jgi:hypothetical protein
LTASLRWDSIDVVGFTDEEAIVRAALDYFEGWYDGDVTKVALRTHPELCKRGCKKGPTGENRINTITAGEIMSDADLYTKAYRELSDKPIAGKAPRPTELEIQVRVDDIHRDIATATVHTTVWIEYLQLARMADGWKVVNTLYARR